MILIYLGISLLALYWLQILNCQQLSDIWLYPVDNAFADPLIKDTGSDSAPPNGTASSKLCKKCERFEFWAPVFRIVDKWPELESSKDKCDFCKMRWDTAKHLDQNDHSFVSFERVESTLRLNDKNTPALSICKSPGKPLSEISIDLYLKDQDLTLTRISNSGTNPGWESTASRS